MKTPEVMKQLAAAKPSFRATHTRYADPEQRRDLLAAILTEDRPHSGDAAKLPPKELRVSARTPRGRYVPASIGIIVTCVALLLGFFAETSIPLQHLSKLPKIAVVSPSTFPSGAGFPGPVGPYLLSLSDGPGLSATTGSEPVYSVTWPEDMHASALRLAQVFGVTGPETNFVDGGVTFGPPSGPAVEVTSQDGILDWTYEGSPTARAAQIGEGRPGSVGAPSGSPPTDAWATAETLKYLASLGLASDLGDPQLSDFRGQVGVVIPVTLDGIEANEQFAFTYGPGDSLEMASGVFGAYALLGSYPTISQVTAVSQLSSQVHYTLLEFLKGCLKNVQGTPVCSGTIESANLGFRYAATPSGSEVLLPEWFLQGPSAGTYPEMKTVGGVVDAIDPVYLKIESQRSNGRG